MKKMSTAEYVDSTSMKCGGCEHSNHANAKFCTSCGHTLFENCPGCGQPVTLLAKFCNGCGCDLKSNLEVRLDRVEENIRKSVELVKKFRFHEALSMLKLVANERIIGFASRPRRLQPRSRKSSILKSSQRNSLAPRRKQHYLLRPAETIKPLLNILRVFQRNY